MMADRHDESSKHVRLHELWPISYGWKIVLVCLHQSRTEENVPKAPRRPRLALICSRPMYVPGLLLRRRRPPAVSWIHLVCLANAIRLLSKSILILPICCHKRW